MMLRRINQLSLFKTIVLWVALSILAYTTLSALWGQGFGWNRIFAGWQIGDTPNPLDRVKVTLTALGGIGAVGYLVIKYRERSSVEQSEADEKVLQAVQQLGALSPQVRIAGVYALTDVADTYGGIYHQRIVDILCGYLRTDRLSRDSNGYIRYMIDDEGSPDHDHPLSADGPVESTILSALANHLYKPINSTNKNTIPGPWSNCEINLQNATITEPLDLSNSFIYKLNILNATFVKKVSFKSTYFTEDLDLDGTAFNCGLIFESATISRLRNIENAKIGHVADFRDATFLGVLSLRSTEIAAPFIFHNAKFEEELNIIGVTFTETVNFWGAKFRKEVTFTDSTFISDVIFRSAIFESRTDLRKIQFRQDSDFGDTTFQKCARLKSVTFKGGAEFSEATFGMDAYFIGVTFENGASFWLVNFNRIVDFDSSEFLDAPMFGEAKFNIMRPRFANTVFCRTLFCLPESTPFGLPSEIPFSKTGLLYGGRWEDCDNRR